MTNLSKKLNQIKVLLGMKIEMVEAILEDGVTKVVAEAFEPGYDLKVVSETGEEAPAPEGIHKLQDGTVVEVDADGKIVSVTRPERNVEIEVEAQEDVKEEVKEEVKEGEEIEEDLKGMIRKTMEAVQELAKEVITIKEEMGRYKEKMSKVPATKKVSTYNTEPSEPATENHIELRLEALKKLQSSWKKPTYKSYKKTN